MADERRDRGDAEDGGVAYPEELLYADRAPIAAVSVRAAVGNRVNESLHVVCSDGACFKLCLDGEWLELEPVPGTERVGTLMAEADARETEP